MNDTADKHAITKALQNFTDSSLAKNARNLLDDNEVPYAKTPAQDEKHALATVKHYRSLVPIASPHCEMP